MKKFFLGLLSILLLFPSLSFPAHAENAEIDLESFLLLDPMTYSVSKIPEPTSDAMGLAYVISDQKIRDYGMRNVWDLLWTVPWMYTRRSTGSDMWVNVFSRGQKWASLFLMDDSNVVGNEWMRTLNMDLIKRVELVMSPGGTLWGANSSFGVVNYITKNGADFNGFHISADAGENETYGINTIYGGKFEDLDVLLSLDLNTTEEPSLHLDRHIEPVNLSEDERLVYESTDTESSADKIFNLFGKLTWKDLSGNFMFYRNKDYWPITVWNDVVGMEGDSREEGKITQDGQAYSLSYQHACSEDLDLMVKGHYSRREEKDFLLPYYKSNEAMPAGYKVLSKSPSTVRYTGDVQLTRKYDFNQLIAGYTYYVDDVEGSTFQYYSKTTGLHTRTQYTADKDRTIHSLYVQDDLSFLEDQLKFQVGLRYENPNDYDSVVNPKAGVLGKISPDLIVKFFYQEGWKSPELGWWGSASSSKIEPEETKAWENEFVYKIREKLILKWGNSIAETSGEVKTITSSSEIMTARKEDSIDIFTSNLSLDYLFEKGTVFLMYTYNSLDQKSDLKSNEVLEVLDDYMPRHSASLGISYTLFENTTLSLLTRYIGERRAFNALVPESEQSYPYYGGVGFAPYTYEEILLFNLNLTIKGDNWEWENKLYNLFDKEYEEPNGRVDTLPIPGTPRTYLSTVRFKF